MIRFVCLLMVFLVSSVAQAQVIKSKDLAQGWGWSAIAVSTLEHQTPAPAPAPKPGDKCPSCNGTGKVGDGVIFKSCMDCDGTGKVGGATAQVGPPVVQKLSKVAEAVKQLALPAAEPVTCCSDGRCDTQARPEPVMASPQAAVITQSPQAVCRGGICYPATVPQVKTYSAQPGRVLRRGLLFRR